ncbi:MAG: hypothetical protein KDD94_05490 [Calditrichaeota bacterium]|nr:hypothetical protein [Calditrichota bacterium]
MDFLSALWLPIVLSAIFVWITSAIIWMAMPHHKSDFHKLPDEEAARDTLGKQNLSPGFYVVPFAMGPDAQKPENQKKFEEGPNLYITAVPKGLPAMGKAIGQSVIFYLIVAVFVAYVLSHSLSADASYLAVFRIAGTIAFMAHSFALIPQSIWFGKPWGSTFKDMADALIYGLLTGGTFGWLWS